MIAHKSFYLSVGVICIAPLVMLILPHAVGAQENVPPIASTAITVDVSELNSLWHEAIQQLEKQEVSAALRKLKEVDIKKAEQGFANLPEHSAVLIQQAYTLKDAGHLADALQLLEFAKQLSPDIAPVSFALAKFRFFKNKLDVYGAGREFFFGFLLQNRDINAIAFYINNVLGVLIVTGLMAGSVFILFLSGYYRRVILFSWFKSLPIPFAIVNIVGWVLIGAITLALGIFWGILALAAFLIPHVEPSSKRGLVGFFLFASLLAVLLIALCISYSVFDGNYIQALRDISYGYYSAATVKTLQQRLQESPDDAYAMFGLAYIASHTGRNTQVAITTYKEMPSSYPDWAAVQNNLGNLYNHEFRKTKNEQQYEAATEAYHSAGYADMRMFEPRYNSGQLFLVKYLPEEAQDQMEAAGKLDQERYTRQLGYLEYGIVTVDATLSISALLQKLTDTKSLNAGLALAQRLWKSGSRFGNPWYFSGVSFVLLLWVGLFGPTKGTPKKVSYCQMCGDPFMVKLRKKRRKQDDEKEEKKPSNFCTQCTYIFKKKTTVKPEKRAQKLGQIQVHQQFRSLVARIGSICLPGAGQIYYGYIGKGFLIAWGFYLGFALVLLKVLMKTLLIMEGSAGPSLVTVGISILLMVGIYLFNLYDVAKLSPRNQ